MAISLPKFTLEDALDLRQLKTSGSVLHINAHYDDLDDNPEPLKIDPTNVDFMGEPVEDFNLLAQKMTNVDPDGLVKKKVLEEGGGENLHEGCTVSIALSGYCENVNEPFVVETLRKPLVVDLKNHGLLPGLDIAVKSMLVGELSIFLFSHKVMYGELGIPPKIPRQAQCVFYIKLVKSILTPERGKIDFLEPNILGRVLREVKLLYASGAVLHKSNNYSQAINSFKKAVNMLHKCRLADEQEEKVQEKFLKKLYINLAVCYNKTNQPYKVCTACNELSRLNSLWNNGKALFQNAKALRMIGNFEFAEKRLKRALQLNPGSKEMIDEMELLIKTRDSCNQAKLMSHQIIKSDKGRVSEDFKKQVDILIKNFKENVNLSKLTMPPNLALCEVAYVKEACIRENLFFNKVPIDVLGTTDSSENENVVETTFALDKEDIQSLTDVKSEESQSSNDGENDQEQSLCNHNKSISTLRI